MTTTSTIATKELIGKIFNTSWGYDATYTDFFLVVDATPKGVKVVKIGSNRVDTGYCTWDETPNKDEILSSPITKRVRNGWNNEVYIPNIDGRKNNGYFLAEGTTVHCDNYH